MSSTLKDVSETGAFVRKDSAFRNRITQDGPYPPVKGRYILYVSYGCPWASRCTAFRVVKGLEDVIELAVVSPVWARTKPDVDDHEGWVFDATYPGATPDPLNLFRTVRDIYDLSMKNTNDSFETRFTVPILFDRESLTIVNNESSEIIRMLNDDFNALAKHPEVDLAPVALRDAIDAVNARTYDAVCNGVYRCGFAHSQSAYDEAVTGLFARLEELEGDLEKQRYLVAGTSFPTEADVRLFVCLVRFDEVYSVHFKCNKKLIREYPNLTGWLRDVYQTLHLAPTVEMKHIKDTYYSSLSELNRYGIIPIGANSVAGFSEPHGRDVKFPSKS